MALTAETTELLDGLDFAPPCFWQNPACESEATWSYACRNCGTGGHTCDQHHTAVESHREDYYCLSCGFEDDKEGVLLWAPIRA